MRIVLLLVIALVAAACGGSADVTPGANQTSDILRINWRLISLSLDGENRPLVETTPTVRFEESGQAGGTNGCNSYGGPVSFAGDEIAFGALFSTEIGCEPVVAAVEQDFMSAISRVDWWSADAGTMTLRASDGSAVLAFVAPVPVIDRPLAGTWVLDTIGDADVVSSIISGTDPTIEISGDQFGGSTGCNALFGTVTTDVDGTFIVRDLGTTDVACDGDIASQESEILAILESAVSFEVEGEHLLIAADDSRFLRYTSAGG